MRCNFNRVTIIKVFVSFVIILLSGIAYCNFKSNTIINTIFDRYFLVKKIDYNTPILLFINNWGFDIAWIVSFYIMLNAFCYNKLTFILTLLSSLYYEISQCFFKNLGTFDLFDILIEVVCILIIYYLFRHFEKEKKT